jgi:hypothetical protein
MEKMLNHSKRKKNLYGAKNPNWKGGRKLSTYGYVLIYMPGHSRCDKKGYVLEHILIVEKAMGKPLPPGAVVHHHDGDRMNNGNKNLLVCQNDAYHKFLYKRIRAFRACGHADWRKCVYCLRYDSLENLKINKRGVIYHAVCARLSMRNQFRLNQAKEGRSAPRRSPKHLH